MNNELTKKQKEVFEQICKYIDENGYSPTVRELCNLCGLSSSATMWVHLQKLKNKGFIYFDDKKFRTIRTNLHDDLEQKYNELEKKINKVAYNLGHELYGHILQNDEETWNEEFYTDHKLDYRKLLIHLLEEVFEILEVDGSKWYDYE